MNDLVVYMLYGLKLWLLCRWVVMVLVLVGLCSVVTR